MATNPKILLLDEPFSALDFQTRLSVSSDISRIIRQEGKTALLVTTTSPRPSASPTAFFVLSARPAVVKSTHDLTAPAKSVAPGAPGILEAFSHLFSSHMEGAGSP